MASDPWARFDSVLNKSKPASPWDRFDTALSKTPPVAIAAWEEWEPRIEGLPVLERRRLPSGEYEYREIFPEAPANPFAHLQEKLDRGRASTGSPVVERDASGALRPRPIEGGLESIAPASKPLPTVGGGVRQVLTRAAEGTASLGMDLPGMFVQGLANAPAQIGNALTAPLRQQENLQAAGYAPPELPLAGPRPGDPVVAAREELHRRYEAERDKTAEMFRDTPALAAVADTTMDLFSDPTNISVGGAGKVALREVGEEALQRAGREAASLAPRVADDLAEYTAEELADLARRRTGLARLRPEDIERTLPEAPASRRLGAGIPDAAVEQRLGMRASPEDAEELRRLSLPIGEEPAPSSFRPSVEVGKAAQSPWGRFDEEVARVAEPSPPTPLPAGRGGVVEIPRPEPLPPSLPRRLEEVLAESPAEVDGRKVRPEIPNSHSIASSLDDYEEVPGVRVLDMSDFDPEYAPSPYSKSERERLENLTEQIRQNREISPLIVVFDDEPFPYILEGGHRFDALRTLGANSFPAKVVVDTSKTTADEVAARLAGRRQPLLLDTLNPSTNPPEVNFPTPFSAASDRPASRTADAAPILRMSTKGIENSTGLQDELHRVVEANRPEIEAARGPVVPVSQWHDAPALAEKLGLAPEDYLRRPADRGPMNADELSLGRHYLGQMKKEAIDLEARLATDAVPDRVAAEAERVAKNRDVVRMMATLQGQGSSEAGRAMRSLQEALDPYGLADTPRDRVRLALLKKYKDANAAEAARLETAAVNRLKRLATRENRKAARAATVDELDEELGKLVQEFRDTSRRPRALSTVVPLDPELVEVVGKMAANRVRAGVVAVEELADQVYTAVARQVDGVTREQVKAAIVEHALAGKQRAPKLQPEEARLRRAEAATARSIKKLEERIAANGALPGGPTSSPWSGKLADLKAKQAALREDLAALKPAAPARDPAAVKLRSREQALARQVEKAEERLASGPSLPQANAVPLDSPRLQELRQRLAEVRAQMAADPKEGLAARYRELLDDQTIEMIAQLPDPADDPEALLDFLRLMERPTFKDYAGAYVYNNLLSGPKSLLKNVGGNTTKRWDRVAMHPIASVIEQVLAPMQGRLPERYVREIVPMIVGSYKGAPEGLQKALFVLKKGWDPERVVAELTGVKGNAKYYEGRLPVDPFLLSQNKAVRALGAVHGYGPRMMQVGDVMSRTRNFSSATYAWATRTAINDAKRGTATDIAARAAQLLKEQPEAMIEYAQRVAREDVFQDEVSGIAKLLGAGRREDTGVGFALNQMVRFLNVPDRIMAWFGDYTPGLRIAGAAWKGGKLRQLWGTPEASDILARQAFGTALAGAAAAWAFQGKLTGNMPRDEKLKNDAYEAGKQPNSVLVGGQWWVPIRDLFGGWAGPVVAAAAFHDSAMTGEPVDGEEVLRRSGGAALGEAKFLLDAGYLSTLSDVVEAINAEPGEKGREAAGLVTRTAAGALIPWSGAQRNVAIFQDPRVVAKDGPLDEVKAGITGLRQTLPARYGNEGQELRQNTGSAGALLPIVPTKNRVADPGGAESIERMRATLTERRREVGRIEAGIKDALKAKNSARVQELRASLPFSIDPESGKPSRVTTARLDKIMEGIRANEQRIRKLRASGKPEAVIRRTEIEIQKRMAERLERALDGLRSP